MKIKYWIIVAFIVGIVNFAVPAIAFANNFNPIREFFPDGYLSRIAYTRGGLAVESAITLTDVSNQQPTAISAITTAAEYDAHGRVVRSLLSGIESSAITIADNSYDKFGRLQSTRICSQMTRSQSYDMHGWLREWNTPFVSQQLRYADGANPSYSGRVSAKITGSYGSSDRYDYSYDRLGRLISADFSREMPPNVASKDGNADYSTTYSYDLQGNILSLTRQGMTAPGFYFCIDDIQATFNGNQLSSLSDDALTVLLESSLDLPRGSWSGDDFSYDANGNQTRDMSRSVTHISYNELNLPSRVEFASGGRIDYLYSATGTKLQEAVYDADGGEIVKREYVGAFEFENDTLVRISLAEGYITACDSTYHAYIPDYQGNIVGVYNTRTNTLEQLTDYYPYGLPHASISSEAAGAEVNRRKFGGKELMSDHGYNSYDFVARHQNPAFPHFTTLDQMAETKPWNSGYLYCGGDPINFIDPTGMDEYVFTISGHLINTIKNSEYDQIKIQNYEEVIVAESRKFIYGTITAHGDETTDNNGNQRQYAYLVTQKTSDATDAFEFLSNNTKVEWTLGTVITKNYNSLNVLTTSHQRSHEGAFNYFLEDNKKKNNSDFIIAITLHIHNHPSGIPIPSDISAYKGDIYNANMLNNAYPKMPILFKIYSAKDNIYVPYNVRSKYSDFWFYKFYKK